MLLTSSTYQGRLLSKNRSIEAPNRAIVIATGNNTGASGEIARRTVPIRLVQTQERQENRTGFQHPNLSQFLTQTRQRHLASLYRLVLNWLALGRPLSTKPLGSFESWSSITGGILEAALYTRHLDNRASWVSSHDEDHEEWSALVALWASLGPLPRTAAEVAQIADGGHLFGRVFAYAKSDKAAHTKFGSMLTKACGQIYGDHRIASLRSGSNRKYVLEKVNEVPPGPAS